MVMIKNDQDIDHRFDDDDRNDCGDEYDDDDDRADELELLLGFLASSLCLRSPSAVIGTHAASHEEEQKNEREK